MRRDEARDAGYLLGDALGTTTRSIGQVHDAISMRVFALLGPPARPVQLMHDAIAGSVYGIVRGSTRLAPRVGGVLAARSRPADAPSIADHPTGNVVLGALNGAWGDAIAEGYRGLAYPMAVRSRGRTVQVTPEGLAAAYPDATGRIAVFLHGLCENDDSWRMGSQTYYGDSTTSFGSRLREDLGWTPVYLRYNTGLHISDNGRRFAQLMQALVDCWPVPLEEVALLGHSMGGLVMRSACHYAQNPPGDRPPLSWTQALRHAFHLGTPHLGAPLEVRTAKLSACLARVPETAPLARLLNSRSVGVKDLRHGSLLDEDWTGVELDTFLDDTCAEVPFRPDAHYYYIGATLHRSPDHPGSAILGDLLVLLPSASGQSSTGQSSTGQGGTGQGGTRTIPFEVERGRHLGGITHFQLLNHPAVYEQIRLWLMPQTPAVVVEDARGEAGEDGTAKDMPQLPASGQ